MASFRTHYDNLKVARDAPPEVIKAAYRALAQRYHPDKNPSADAARIMKLINEAWDVLGNPAARRLHDQWIEDQLIAEVLAEATRDASTNERTARARPTPNADSPAATEGSASNLDRFNSWLARSNWSTYVLIGGAVLVVVLWALPKQSTQTPPTSLSQPEQLVIPGPTYSEVLSPRYSATATPLHVDERDFRPFGPTSGAKAGSPTPATVRWSPTGQPWPAVAGYLKGNNIRQRAFGGLSKVTIDNTGGGSNVYVKLCRPDIDRCDDVRHAYIPQGASFTMVNIAPGVYDVRYRDLTSGQIARSEPIQLQQKQEVEGTKFSVIRLTLYRVAGGNTSFAPLTEEQF